MGTAQARPDEHPERGEERKLERELDDTGREHPPRERDDRDVEHRCKPQRRTDQADVEQNRGEGRDRKSAVSVENASREGDERDEEHVRKRDPHHLDGERVLRGVGQKPGGEYGNECRRREDADDGDGGEHPDQRPRDMRSQIAHFGDVALRAILAQNGHERLGKGAFGEQPAQKVRDSERDEEGIGPGTGAERLGDDDIAHESEDARCQCARADHSRRFEERPAHRIEGRPGMDRMRRAGTIGTVGVSVLSGIRAVGIIARPSIRELDEESRSGGELCPSKKARTAGGAQARS